jgi:hypothetical protein
MNPLTDAARHYRQWHQPRRAAHRRAANLGNVERAARAKVEAQRSIALDAGIGWKDSTTTCSSSSRNGDGRYGFINSPEEAATDFVGQLPVRCKPRHRT